MSTFLSNFAILSSRNELLESNLNSGTSNWGMRCFSSDYFQFLMERSRNVIFLRIDNISFCASTQHLFVSVSRFTSCVEQSKRNSAAYSIVKKSKKTFENFSKNRRLITKITPDFHDMEKIHLKMREPARIHIYNHMKLFLLTNHYLHQSNINIKIRSILTLYIRDVPSDSLWSPCLSFCFGFFLDFSSKYILVLFRNRKTSDTNEKKY